MEQLLGLGLNALNVGAEQAVPRLPDRALHIRNPEKKRRKAERKAKEQEQQQPRRDRSDSEYDDDSQNGDRGRRPDPYDDGYADEEIPRQAYGTSYPYQPDPYKNPNPYAPQNGSQRYIYQDPASKRELTPETGYYLPPGQRQDPDDRYRPDSYNDYPYGQQALTREKASRPPRRSRSSYHRSRDESPPSKSTRSSSRPRRPRSAGLEDFFSTSDKGIGALSIGALAGGFAAYKAGKAKNVDPVLAALAGGAAGGLGANALETQYERKKRDRGARSERRREKYEDS
ncbi:MAG: hypothetical protein M1818_008462 [Claussenomyces sp. TS43310]|nr:MAG: hypothetical protein M1818_008462 [Claussenomyces sp. TS43310]